MEYVVDEENDAEGEAEKVDPLSDDFAHGFELLLEVGTLLFDFELCFTTSPCKLRHLANSAHNSLTLTPHDLGVRE